MSHLDPFGGHTPSDDWSSPAGGGRDERSRARHDGAAPDPYADYRRDADAWPPGIEPQPDDPGPVDVGPVDVGPAAVGPAAVGPLDLGPAVARLNGAGVEAVEQDSPATGWIVPAPADAAHDHAAPDYHADPDYAAPDRHGATGSGPVDAPGPVAYPMEPLRRDPPPWEAPTAATSTSQAEFDAPRGPGRRRAGRSGSTAAAPAGRSGRAGRNLGAAIAVGLSLGALIIASLFIYKPAFVGVVVVAAAVGIWEMVRALRHSGAAPALIPLVAGGVLMIGLARYDGTDGLLLGLAVTVAAAMVWRVGDGVAGLRRDLTATVLISVYVPFLLGFAMLLVTPDDGGRRVVATVLAVVLSDTGGYAAGVFLGRHKMAPTISPSKSWEGFGGSVLAAALGSALVLFLMLDVTPWQGAVFGAVVSVVAVLGDLTESMMKRDLGIKDMSQLLPGHGGLMDRLDSILFAVPTAYLLLSLIAPSG